MPSSSTMAAPSGGAALPPSTATSSSSEDDDWLGVLEEAAETAACCEQASEQALPPLPPLEDAAEFAVGQLVTAGAVRLQGVLSRSAAAAAAAEVDRALRVLRCRIAQAEPEAAAELDVRYLSAVVRMQAGHEPAVAASTD